MKLSLLFVLGCAGCATAVVEQPEQTPTTKDAGKKDAAQSGYDAAQMQGQDSGTNESPDVEQTQDSGGTCSLMINYGSQNCQSCMQACCAQDNACVGSNDCIAVINCMNMCAQNDSSCISTCRGQHASGAQLLDAISSCMKAQCSSTCP